eukprot:scaffold19940_cov124-Isochrysis_galbana.AAC.2
MDGATRHVPPNGRGGRIAPGDARRHEVVEPPATGACARKGREAGQCPNHLVRQRLQLRRRPHAVVQAEAKLVPWLRLHRRRRRRAAVAVSYGAVASPASLRSAGQPVTLQR